MDDIKNIKRSSVISLLSLFLQSGYASILGLVANLLLTILLSPTVFGIYFTVLSLIALLNYFSDIGLAASLIQKKELKEEDVRTTFTVQQILILSLIAIGFIVTSFVRKFYNLPVEGTYLYWALLGSFFLSSLKTIPSIFLERKIQFQKIVFVSVIENTVFYVTAVTLAYYNFGLMSFTVAVLLRAITGVVAIYTISRWTPQFGISLSSLKRLLSFGLPFQTSSFLALFKDDLIILFLSKFLGFEAVGYIGWAKKWAEAPIRIIMDNVSRVLFPVIARIQHDRERVGRLVEKVLYYQTMLLAPAMIGLTLIMPHLVQNIPRYSKWEPALPLFYLFSVAAFFASYSTPFINLFNALGKVRISFSFMLFWTVSTWLLTPVLSSLFGVKGYPLTQLILAFSSVFVAVTARRILTFDFFRNIYGSILSSILMGVILYLLLIYLGTSLLGLAVAGIIAGVSFFLILLSLFRINMITQMKALFNYD